MANEKQKNYWTNLAGKKWLANADEMEVRFAAINDVLMHQAALLPGERVLDIGCGTGITSLAAARLVGPKGQVKGMDVSEPMLQAARAMAKRSGLNNLDFILADAQTDDPKIAADRLISRFGVMFFEDPVAAFTNLRCNAASGAGLAFVAWAPLAKNEHWLRPLELARALVGEGAARHPRAPGPLAFGDTDYVISILKQSGWGDVGIKQQMIDLMGTSLEREAQMACTLGPSAALLEEKHADEKILKEAKRIFLKSLPEYVEVMPDGRIRVPATINIVTATA